MIGAYLHALLVMRHHTLALPPRGSYRVLFVIIRLVSIREGILYRFL